MKIAVYGGSFNPPHLGHIQAVESVSKCLHPDRILVMPTYEPPHKELSPDAPDCAERLALCHLAFDGMDGVEVSNLEIEREGRSYTSDTLHALRQRYPNAELVFVMGTDMILTLETWHEPERVMADAQLAVLLRGEEDDAKVAAHIAYLKNRYQADVTLLSAPVRKASSTQLRAALKQGAGREQLSPRVYAEIIQKRLYGAKAELSWLRERAVEMLAPKRVPHVMGCAAEAAKLARHWGADAYEAEAAGILHDITKKCSVDEQLRLCDKYGIIIDMSVAGNEKTLHQTTGAAVAEAEFGVSPAVRDAIRWHTTGKPDMTVLEKILYLADYIEPTRDFDGVEDLRALSYQSLDAAMALGLKMTIDDLNAKGAPILEVSGQAYLWFKDRREGSA